MRRLIPLCAGLMLAMTACSERPAGEPLVRAALDGSNPLEAKASPSPTPAIAADSACRAVSFEQVPLTVCTADPAKHRISMANLGADKQPFGSLSALAASTDPATIAFAINGGMYGDDLKPVGYYVENGERLKELDRGDGPKGAGSNFYMKPNGVFFGSGGGWRVLASNTFFETVGDRPQFGTQSGPLLLVDGKLHPEIQDDGPSKAIRSAVGVDTAGKAHFVISDATVSFGQLARFYRDELKVATALYLDGQMSSLWDPASERQDKGRVGPIIVVTKREEAKAQ